MLPFSLQKELFCKAVNSKSIRLFLEWFTETQMFEEFISHKVELDKSHTTGMVVILTFLLLLRNKVNFQ